MGFLADPLGAFEWGTSCDGPLSDLRRIERELEARGVPFLREFSWDAGEWRFTIDGVVVARGGAIGTLETDLIRWWRSEASHPS